MREFILGAGFVNRGFKLVFSTKKLFLVSLIPLTIDLIIWWSLIFTVGPLISGLVTTALGFIFSNPDSFFYTILYYPLLASFWIVFAIGITAIVFLLASVVASPFNAFLAEQTLMKRGALPESPFEFSKFVSNSIKMFLVSLLRTGILILFGLFLFVMSFIPVLNLFASYMAFVVLAFDVADYSQEARQYSLRERLSYIQRHKMLFAGMGMPIGLLSLIPGILLFFMPFMVVGFADLMSELNAGKNDTRVHT